MTVRSTDAVVVQIERTSLTRTTRENLGVRREHVEHKGDKSATEEGGLKLRARGGFGPMLPDCCLRSCKEDAILRGTDGNVQRVSIDTKVTIEEGR